MNKRWLIEPQPKWPNGDEPTKIDNVSMGFFDGVGDSFSKPQGATEAIKENGLWYWVAASKPFNTNLLPQDREVLEVYARQYGTTIVGALREAIRLLRAKMQKGAK